MKEITQLNGIVLSAHPSEDYDKRLVVLTGECGRITVFARGVRRPHSQFGAAASPFCFGTWELMEGRSAYNLVKVNVKNYFRELTSDVEACYFGFYFLEFADFVTVENVDSRDFVNLLYLSLTALLKPAFDNETVRRIFEIKALELTGEYPTPAVVRQDLPSIGESTMYTLNYILTSPIKNLFSFEVSKEVQTELGKICDYYIEKFIGRSFKSLDILNTIRA